MKSNDKQLTTSILRSLIDFRSKLNESNSNSNNNNSNNSNNDGDAGSQSLKIANETDANKEETKSSNLKSSSLSHSKDVEFIFKIFRSEVSLS
ncbi:unnamed protein product [Trichobilharzia regenti]|nr:unnamed protein product [Trichobilharzia regenti]